MAAEKHAVLSASASHKWLHCPPSALLEDSLPDNTSEAAEKGTLAHAICELKLNKLFIDKNMTSKTFNTRMNKLKRNPLYEPEMERSTDTYVDIVKQIAYGFETEPMVIVEKKVDYSKWAPKGFGTSDCILIHSTELHVVDYKNGTGVVVSAEDNPQMKLYALGALEAYGLIYPVEKVVLHIVQPNRDNYSTWETTKAELLKWGETVVKPAAEKAIKGEGEFCQGEWCDSGFCRARALCRKRMDENMALMAEAVDPIGGKSKLPPLITDDEVGAILKKAQFLSSWVKKLEEYALKTLTGGGTIPGWKLIEGRSNRTISDTDSAFEALIRAGYDRALLYEEKPITLTAVEKLVDKDVFTNCIAPFIVKPQGKPTLVPEDDRRPEMKLKTSAEEAFGGENSFKEEEKCQ